MENKKKLIMVVLSVLVCVMAVGYAVLSTQLNINGTASIDSTWRVEITNITEKDVVGDALSKETPSYTATTASFSVGLTQPTDSITYDIEVSNLGSLKAKVDSISVSMDQNDAIIYKTEGLVSGDTLGVNEKDTLSVTVTYNPEVTSQPSVTLKEITVTINYVQDLGQGSSVTYDTYSIGDTVTFAGSNWYVIKNSGSEEDYITLMKEQVLTNAELGEYAVNYTNTCTANDVTYGWYGCTIEGETVTLPYDTMSYYWSDTCHDRNSYGYLEYDSSGCEGHNDYEGSKVKEYLEGTYINTLGTDNLKEVDGYKVRLITWDELLGDLGYSMDVTSGGAGLMPIANDNVPLWVYQNFGDSNNGVAGYWTMTSVFNHVWHVESGGTVSYNDVSIYNRGIRPVINLLKSSIE